MNNLIDIQSQIDKLQKQAADIKIRDFDKTVAEIVARDSAAAGNNPMPQTGKTESPRSPEQFAVPPEQQIALRYSYQLIRDRCYEHGISFAAVSDFCPPITLRNTCDELGVPLLDISRRLARHESSPDRARPWHFLTDPHLTEFGNRMMAEGIEEELQRHFPGDENSTATASTAHAASGSDRKPMADRK